MIRKRARLFWSTVGAAVLAPTGAQADWQVATTRHFVIYMDDSPDRVRAYAEATERFDKATRVLHQSPDHEVAKAGRVTIYVVPTVDAVQKISGIATAAGLYDARVTGSIALMPRNGGSGTDEGLSPRAILQHEYTHHWMLTTWTDASFPLWLIEGFAELHATALQRGGSVTFGAAPAYRRYAMAATSQNPMRVVLTAPSLAGMDGAQQDVFYGRSWLLTDYLMFDPGRRKLLADYIIAYNHKGPREAAKLFGDPAALDARLDTWFRRTAFPTYTFTPDQLPISAAKVRALTPAEAATMPALIQSQVGVDARRAPLAVANARSAAAAFPNDAAPLNELAEAEYDLASSGPKDAARAGYARAAAAADAAIRADPTSTHALVYRGMADQALAELDKSTDAARWQSIRHYYAAANKADPDDPWPMFQYYRSFAAANMKPTANAETGMLYAYQLAPYDAAVRMAAGRVLLGEDKPAEARVALAPIVTFGEGKDALGPRVRQILAALDSGGAKAALAEFDHPPEAGASAQKDPGSTAKPVK